METLGSTRLHELTHWGPLVSPPLESKAKDQFSLSASSVVGPVALLLPSRSVQNRATPTIGNGFTAQETVQILDGLKDAFTLASYGIHNFPASVYVKYFEPADVELVLGKFHQSQKSPYAIIHVLINAHRRLQGRPRKPSPWQHFYRR